jgi:hypothetical protein
MPVIRVEYDSKLVSEVKAQALCKAAQTAVIEATGIPETFVYCNSSQITIGIAPVEIWVEISAHKVPEPAKTAKDIRAKLAAWKQAEGFEQPINLTLIPMDWILELEF